MDDRNRPLEHAFTPAIVDDEPRLARIEGSLRRVMTACGVFVDDPVRAQELLGVVMTYLRYTCPRGVDEESLAISALYGMIIILHGTGILTGAHLELTPEAFVRIASTGELEGRDPPESARLLAELGRWLRARRGSDEGKRGFIHYAGRTYRSYRDKREQLLRGQRPASLGEYVRNREYRIGVFPWIWLWVGIDALVPPARLLGDARLRRMLALTNEVTYLRNDVATLRRDVHDGMDNYVLLLQAELGCDRARALEITRERSNDRVCEVLALEREVLGTQVHEGSEEVARYADFLRSLMIGNVRAFAVFERMRYIEMDTLA